MKKITNTSKQTLTLAGIKMRPGRSIYLEDETFNATAAQNVETMFNFTVEEFTPSKPKRKYTRRATQRLENPVPATGDATGTLPDDAA